MQSEAAAIWVTLVDDHTGRTGIQMAATVPSVFRERYRSAGADAHRRIGVGEIAVRVKMGVGRAERRRRHRRRLLD